MWKPECLQDNEQEDRKKCTTKGLRAFLAAFAPSELFAFDHHTDGLFPLFKPAAPSTNPPHLTPNMHAFNFQVSSLPLSDRPMMSDGPPKDALSRKEDLGDTLIAPRCTRITKSEETKERPLE